MTDAVRYLRILDDKDEPLDRQLRRLDALKIVVRFEAHIKGGWSIWVPTDCDIDLCSEELQSAGFSLVF